MRFFALGFSLLLTFAMLTQAQAAPMNIEVGRPDVVEKDWKVQYDQTKAQIGGHRRYNFPPEQLLNKQATILDTDKTPLDVAVRRIEATMAKIKEMPGAPDTKELEKTIAQIKSEIADGKAGNADSQENINLYMELRRAARKVILANPLIDFDDILFVSRSVINDHARGKSEYDGDHFCDQYYGHNGSTGGGLYALKNFKSDDPKLINLLASRKVPSGTNKGMDMSEGALISPDLSWDGKTIAFGWSRGDHQKWQPENRFNVFKMNVDGSDLTRLTDGDFDDFDPIFLPNGRIVFMSTRRYGFGRCHGRPVPAYTMYSMKDDGSDLYSIDFHETNEFHPSVDNNGMLVYTRWDYVDRDHNGAHHMWHAYPDGRDPRAYHANYAFPRQTVEDPRDHGSIRDRPWAEFNCRSVPNSHKFIATAGPHHGQAFGSLVLIDTSIRDDNKMSQVKRITPDTKFPESETGTRSREDMAYGTSWPLSESYYLTNYKEGAYVLDEFGNRELICQTTNMLRVLDPMPLQARKKPPIIPTKTYQGERAGPNAPKATISVMNVYITDEFGKLPEGVKIKQLRVVQVIPKSTPRANSPRMGYGDQSLGRIPLGVVPVEKDGSVFFQAPVGKAIYFQLLDENGMAVQSMRSVTYVHPGEQMSCVGCHESKWDPPPTIARPMAMMRAPSELQPEVEKFTMFSFHRNVRPIFEKKCIPCHTETKDAGPKNMDFGALEKYMFYFGHGIGRPLHGGSRTVPGKFGAMFSGMGKALMGKTHQKAFSQGKFTEEDLRSIFMWLDMNSNEFTAYKEVDAQKKGEIVWPDFDVDPNNYNGVEWPASPASAN